LHIRARPSREADAAASHCGNGIESAFVVSVTRPGDCLIAAMPHAHFTVVAADDHPVVLSGIRLALRESSDFSLLAEACDAATTLAAIEREVPDLLILDLWMEGNDGIELLCRIHKRWPSLRVLVYSMNDERIFAPRSLSAGAAGYLMKSHGLDELLSALRVVTAGQRYLSPIMEAQLIAAGLCAPSEPATIPEIIGLTNREIQILRMIGLGHRTATIASELNISAKTVGAHRENLKNKLNADNSAELVQQAVQLVTNRLL
jgi:DNA-binding NarL/FixJ family response regulator